MSGLSVNDGKTQCTTGHFFHPDQPQADNKLNSKGLVTFICHQTPASEAHKMIIKEQVGAKFYSDVTNWLFFIDHFTPRPARHTPGWSITTSQAPPSATSAAPFCMGWATRGWSARVSKASHTFTLSRKLDRDKRWIKPFTFGKLARVMKRNWEVALTLRKLIFR